MSEVEWIRHYHPGSDILRYEASYVNGLHHGVEKSYYKDGTLLHESLWVNGQLHGMEREFYCQGLLKNKALWIRGYRRNDLLGDEHRLIRLVLLGEQSE